MRRLLALLSIVVFALFVVELSPHLVHHALDHAVASDCPFATIAERQHPDAPVGVDLARGPERDDRLVLVEAGPSRSLPVAVSAARAPPAASA